MSAGGTSDVDPVREVERLHLLLSDWYNGIRDDIDPIVSALAEDFTWIGPEGVLQEREGAVRAFQERRDDYSRSTPPVSVEVEDVAVQRTIYGVHQVTYRKRVRVDGEWQEFGCSLWFRETERVSTGLQWLHLTETPRAAAPEDDPTDD